MKVNEKSLVHYATGESPADNSGFLYKKGEHNAAYHRRWFVLKANMLFYFEDKSSREPLGAIIMEGCTVEPSESTEEYTFTIRFAGSKSRTYILAADSEAAMQAWVKSLSRANFDYMRLVVKELQLQLEDMEQYAMANCTVQGDMATDKDKPSSKSNSFSQQQSHEKPAFIGSAVKDNGCAVWNNSQITVHIPNGHTGDTSLGNIRKYSGSGLEGSLRPPPVPPRRLPSSNIGSVAGLSAQASESPVSSGIVLFSKLHDWYGQEIVELKMDWVGKKRGNEQQSGSREEIELGKKCNI